MAPWTVVAVFSLAALCSLVAFTTLSGPSSRPLSVSHISSSILQGDWEGFLAWRPRAAVANLSGFTEVANRLNEMMRRNTSKVYTGGRGVLVRNIFDSIQFDSNWRVVPAIFWVNDILTPTQMPPMGDPTKNEQWEKPNVAVVVGTALGNFFEDIERIQEDGWGFGVFYPSESHSAFFRCRYDEAADSWDCPGGTVLGNGQFQKDFSKKGAINYPAGNPRVSAFNGGGSGCHFQYDKHFIDQINSRPGSPDNLVQNRHCECNYNYARKFPQDEAHSAPHMQNGWDQWVSDFATLGLHGKAGPAMQVALASCWTNNVRDMINLQNRLYWMHLTWFNGSAPLYQDQPWDPVADRRRYWGWNQVPVDRELIGDPENWDALVIRLPAFTCGVPVQGRPDNADCLDGDMKQTIAGQLEWHVTKKVLVPGLDHINQRPGSYVLFSREILDDMGGWSREFFCQNLTLPGYRVVYNPPDQKDPAGKCYVDRS